MKNLVQEGRKPTMVAPTGGVTSGQGVLLGKLFGIALTTADAGEKFCLVRDGKFAHAKNSAEAWSIGDNLYWDATNKVFTKTASTHELVAVAAEAADNPSATGVVILK
jgi:predicted RecA/RadA family phage recombinase